MSGPIILWLSRHKPTPRQILELNRLFPGHLLKRDTRTFTSADTIVERFHKSGAAEMVVVAPLSFVRELVRRGLHPIWAEMRQISRGSPLADSHNNGRSYQFVRFRRISKIKVEYEDLLPPPSPTTKSTAAPPTTSTDDGNDAQRQGCNTLTREAEPPQPTPQPATPTSSTAEPVEATILKGDEV